MTHQGIIVAVDVQSTARGDPPIEQSEDEKGDVISQDDQHDDDPSGEVQQAMDIVAEIELPLSMIHFPLDQKFPSALEGGRAPIHESAQDGRQDQGDRRINRQLSMEMDPAAVTHPSDQGVTEQRKSKEQKKETKDALREDEE